MGGNCGPGSIMNDEFVSHNKSSGGWDVLSKWVSVLERKGVRGQPPVKGVGGPVLCLNLKAALCF